MMAMNSAHALRIFMSVYPWLADLAESLGRDSVIAEFDAEAYKKLQADLEAKARDKMEREKGRQVLKDIREKAVQDAWWQ